MQCTRCAVENWISVYFIVVATIKLTYNIHDRHFTYKQLICRKVFKQHSFIVFGSVSDWQNRHRRKIILQVKVENKKFSYTNLQILFILIPI